MEGGWREGECSEKAFMCDVVQVHLFPHKKKNVEQDLCELLHSECLFIIPLLREKERLGSAVLEDF